MPSLQKKTKPVFYAVQKGRPAGVFLTWPECQAAIKGVSGSVYQKFETLIEAEAFVALNPITVTEAVASKQTFEKEAAVEPDIYIYTDGACSNNGQPGSKAGIGIWFGPADSRNVSEALDSGATNNVAELTAILRVLPLVLADVKAGKRVAIVSDSQYAIRCAGTYGAKQAASGWSADIPNKTLVKSVFEQYTDQKTIQFLYVAAHTEGTDRHSVGNAGADRLANLAIGVEECPYAVRKFETATAMKGRIDLKVPYAQKEAAKALGAKWDAKAKIWYCLEESQGTKQLVAQFS